MCVVGHFCLTVTLLSCRLLICCYLFTNKPGCLWVSNLSAGCSCRAAYDRGVAELVRTVSYVWCMPVGRYGLTHYPPGGVGSKSGAFISSRRMCFSKAFVILVGGAMSINTQHDDDGGLSVTASAVYCSASLSSSYFSLSTTKLHFIRNAKGSQTGYFLWAVCNFSSSCSECLFSCLAISSLCSGTCWQITFMSCCCISPGPWFQCKLNIDFANDVTPSSSQTILD